MNIQLERKNDAVHFEAINEDGIKVQLDGSPNIGGENKGTRPMQMLLMGLGGCSGIDVVMILNKQKINPEVIRININATRVDTVPSIFENIHVVFEFGGAGLDEKKLKRAVSLSMDKYCSVAKILGESASITHDIKILD